MDLPHTLLSSPGPDSPCPCARWPAGFPASPNSFVAPAIYLLVSLFPFCRWSVQWTSPGLVDFVAVPLFICSRAPDRWANVDFFSGPTVWRKESGYGSSVTETHRCFLCLFCFYPLTYFSNMPGHIKTTMICLH